jgi:hypothetical protein
MKWSVISQVGLSTLRDMWFLLYPGSRQHVVSDGIQNGILWYK